MRINDFIENLSSTYHEDEGVDFMGDRNLPDKNKILNILHSFLEIFFPGYIGKTITKRELNDFLTDHLQAILPPLVEQLDFVFKYQNRSDDPEKVASEILMHLPEIRRNLKGDVIATFEGDPAANSLEEIVLSYPGIIAISIYRIANEFYKRNIIFFPRIMSEYAHAKTGIDIHPGATIGKSFFIDHGTGVVIGETSIIGDNVKIYQGVTLGALSPAKGQCLKKVKRHPTIENDVTIYAAATILGDVTIGEGSIIGGNVWIKDSIPPKTIVMMPEPKLIQKSRL